MRFPSIIQLSIALAGILALASCHGKQTSNASDELATTSQVVTEQDSAYYGHLGEGTGMSVIELLTDQGDTLDLCKADEYAKTYGDIIGEIANYTDRFAVTTRRNGECLGTALNITQLCGRWQGTAAGSPTLVLGEDGSMTIQPGQQPQQGQGHRVNCKLVATQEATKGENRTDTFAVMQLNADSMILQQQGSKATRPYIRIK